MLEKPPHVSVPDEADWLTASYTIYPAYEKGKVDETRSAPTVSSRVMFAVGGGGGLTGFVMQKLKHALMAGELKPGERLITRDLAGVLRTSLTPVREALLKLVVLGALETTPAQAFQVPVMSAKRYREIADIRRALESMAAERAAQAMTPALLSELEAINDRYRTARHAGDIKSALRLNMQFRFTLYAAADMPTLLALIESLWLQIGPSLNFLSPRPTQVDFGRHAYDEVITALRLGDHEAVRRAVELAINAGTRILMVNFGEALANETPVDGRLAHLP